MTGIERREAAAALSDIESLGRRVRQSLLYRRAGAMLMLWGVATFTGYAVTFFAPMAARLIWPAVFAGGIAGSVIAGAMNARREGVRTFGTRMLAAFVVFIAFGCIWSLGIGQFSPRQLGVFWTTYFMLPYIIIGLWFGYGFIVIGSAVTALTLIGYGASGSFFNLWMAVVNGGGLILGGWWMRRG